MAHAATAAEAAIRAQQTTKELLGLPPETASSPAHTAASARTATNSISDKAEKMVNRRRLTFPFYRPFPRPAQTYTDCWNRISNWSSSLRRRHDVTGHKVVPSTLPTSQPSSS